jgi:hypothetical protein
MQNIVKDCIVKLIKPQDALNFNQKIASQLKYASRARKKEVNADN